MHYLLLLLTILFWSGNFIVGRGVHQTVPPVTLAFWRWLVALLLILPFSLPQLIREKSIILKNWAMLSLLALLSISGFSVFLYQALNASPVTNTALINSITPILIVVFSRLGDQETFTPYQLIGVVISLAGLFFIVLKGNPADLLTLHFSRGDLWTLSAALCWSLYSVLYRRFTAALSALSYLTSAIVIGLVFITPFYLMEAGAAGLVVFTPQAAAAIVYVAVFPSILAFIFWNRAIQVIGASRSGVFIHLIPVFSIILAIVFLNETLKPYHLIGAILIFGGIWLTTAPSIRKQSEAALKK